MKLAIGDPNTMLLDMPHRSRLCSARGAGRLTGGLLGSLLLCACGAAVAPIRRLPPGVMDFVSVPRPPPVVPLEIQPPQPQPGAAWVEGSWSWTGRDWSWKPGAWVLPAAGSTVSPWTFSYQEDGRVRFWPTTWRDAAGQAMEAPPALAVAKRRLDMR